MGGGGGGEEAMMLVHIGLSLHAEILPYAFFQVRMMFSFPAGFITGPCLSVAG